MIKTTPLKLNTTYIIIGVVVLLFLVGLGYYFYRQGKKKVTNQYLPDELPGDTSGQTQTGASNDEIKSISTDLYNDMKGWNALGHKDAPYKRAVLLNDRDIVKLYNAFNALYQSDSGQTLTQWLQSEYFSSDESYGPLLKDRLKKLNCL